MVAKQKTPREVIEAALREYAEATSPRGWEDVSAMVTRGPGLRPVFVVVSRDATRRTPRSPVRSRG